MFNAINSMYGFGVLPDVVAWTLVHTATAPGSVINTYGTSSKFFVVNGNSDVYSISGVETGAFSLESLGTGLGASGRSLLIGDAFYNFVYTGEWPEQATFSGIPYSTWGSVPSSGLYWGYFDSARNAEFNGYVYSALSQGAFPAIYNRIAVATGEIDLSFSPVGLPATLVGVTIWMSFRDLSKIYFIFWSNTYTDISIYGSSDGITWGLEYTVPDGVFSYINVLDYKYLGGRITLLASSDTNHPTKTIDIENGVLSVSDTGMFTPNISGSLYTDGVSLYYLSPEYDGVNTTFSVYKRP